MGLSGDPSCARRVGLGSVWREGRGRADWWDGQTGRTQSGPPRACREYTRPALLHPTRGQWQMEACREGRPERVLASSA